MLWNFNHSEVYDGIKTCNHLHFFTYESINSCNTVEISCLHSDLVFFSISKLQYRNSNSYFNLLLLLSGDIRLNPGPLHNNQLQPQSEWSVFNSRGIHFIHLNVNSLLPKIDELGNIAKLSNAAIIGTSKSKLTIPFSHLKYTLITILHFAVIGTDMGGRGSLLHKERFKFWRLIFFYAWNWKRFLRSISTKYETNSCRNYFLTT